MPSTDATSGRDANDIRCSDGRWDMQSAAIPLPRQRLLRLVKHQIYPNFFPKVGSRPIPSSPEASHVQNSATPMSSEIGTVRDTSGRSEILLFSLVMRRSGVRISSQAPVLFTATGEVSRFKYAYRPPWPSDRTSPHRDRTRSRLASRDASSRCGARTHPSWGPSAFRPSSGQSAPSRCPRTSHLWDLARRHLIEPKASARSL